MILLKFTREMRREKYCGRWNDETGVMIYGCYEMKCYERESGGNEQKKYLFILKREKMIKKNGEKNNESDIVDVKNVFVKIEKVDILESIWLKF